LHEFKERGAINESVKALGLVFLVGVESKKYSGWSCSRPAIHVARPVMALKKNTAEAYYSFQIK
jgi:hypothetical protein